MAADAPTEQLATDYQRLGREIDAALAKLDELEGRGATMAGTTPVPPPPPPPSPRMRTSAGDRPLAAPPGLPPEEPTVVESAAKPGNGARVAIIVVAGALVLAAIVFLIWRGSERKGTTAIVEQPSTTSTTETVTTSAAPVVTPAARPAAASGLKITPVVADYGTIRKGTRAVRQFEVFNDAATPVTLQVSRSSCRCLYYEYRDKVPPKKKETITVTVDGAKAKAGALRETINVTAKEDPSLTAGMTVQAEIK
jgi:hypothetical protein